MLRQQMTETMYDDTIQHVRHINFLNLILRIHTFSSIFSIILHNICNYFKDSSVTV